MTRRKPQPIAVPENITLVGPPDEALDTESLPPKEYPPTEGDDPRNLVEGHGHTVGTSSLQPLSSQGRIIR